MQQSAVVLAAFLDAFLSDKNAGCPRTLAQYQVRFPGYDEMLSEAYARLVSPGESTTVHAEEHLDHGLQEVRGGDRLGEFELLRRIGEGGQGSVWEARQPDLDRLVALKLLPRERLLAGRQLERFQREARITSRISDRGICSVYQSGHAAGVAYIAMQLIHGESLRDALGRQRQDSGETASTAAGPVVQRGLAGSAPALRRTLLFFERLCRSMHAAHRLGVVHRDIKPGNIMIAEDGRPVILDFGLARDDMDAEIELTMTGDVLGTPAYMAPEQTKGLKGIDRRTDVHAIGAVLFEVLTGQRLFQGTTPAALTEAILHQEPPSARQLNREVSRDLDIVLGTALAKEPENRFLSCADLGAELRRVRKGEPIECKPAGPGLRFKRMLRRRPLAVGITLSTGAALLVGFVVALAFWQMAVESEKIAVDEGKRARRLAYTSSLNAAANLVGAGDVNGALDRLETCPEEYRGPVWRLLSARCDGSLSRFSTGVSGVRRVWFSSDGEGEGDGWLATTGAAQLWRSELGGEPVEVKGVVPENTALLSGLPKRSIEASCDIHGMMRWRGGSGEDLSVQLTGTPRSLLCVKEPSILLVGEVLHADRAHGVLGTAQVRAFRPGNSTATHTWQSPGAFLEAMTLSRDGRTLAVALRGGPRNLAQVVILDAHTLEPLADGALDSQGWIKGISRPSRQGWLTVVLEREFGEDTELIQLSTANGEVLNRRSVGLQLTSSVVLAPDGDVAAAGIEGGGILVFPTATNVRARVFLGHRDDVTAMDVSADGFCLLSGDAGGEIRVWEMGTGDATIRIPCGAPPSGLRFSRDGTRLIHRHRAKELVERQVQTGAAVGGWHGPSNGAVGWDTAAHLVLFSHAGNGEPLQSHDWSDSEGRRRVDSGSSALIDLRVQQGAVISLSPRTGALVLFDTSGEILGEWQTDIRFMSSAVLSRGRGQAEVAVRDTQGRVVWCLAGGEVRQLSCPDGGSLSAITLTRDGHHLLAGGAKGHVLFFSRDAASPIFMQRAHRGRVRSLAVHPKTNVVVTTGEGGVLRFWSLPLGEHLGDLNQNEPMSSVVFTPGGEYLATTSSESIQLFSLEGYPEGWRERQQFHRGLRAHRVLLGDDGSAGGSSYHALAAQWSRRGNSPASVKQSARLSNLLRSSSGRGIERRRYLVDYIADLYLRRQFLNDEQRVAALSIAELLSPENSVPRAREFQAALLLRIRCGDLSGARRSLEEGRRLLGTAFQVSAHFLEALINAWPEDGPVDEVRIKELERAVSNLGSSMPAALRRWVKEARLRNHPSCRTILPEIKKLMDTHLLVRDVLPLLPSIIAEEHLLLARALLALPTNDDNGLLTLGFRAVNDPKVSNEAARWSVALAARLSEGTDVRERALLLGVLARYRLGEFQEAGRLLQSPLLRSWRPSSHRRALREGVKALVLAGLGDVSGSTASAVRFNFWMQAPDESTNRNLLLLQQEVAAR